MINEFYVVELIALFSNWPRSKLSRIMWFRFIWRSYSFKSEQTLGIVVVQPKFPNSCSQLCCYRIWSWSRLKPSEYTAKETLVYQAQDVCVDDFSQKIWRNACLKGTDMHYKFSIGKCIEKRKLLETSHPLRKDHAFLTLRFN